MSAKWATTTIGEVAKLVSGRKPPLRAIAREADLPFLSAKVMRGTQSPEYGDPNHRDSVVANADDLVIICTGSNSGEVFTGQAGIVASTMAKIDVKPHIDSTYLRYFLKWNFSFLNSRMKGMAIPSLDRKLLSALTIPVPPLAEQKRIARTLDESFEGIATAKANAEKNLQNTRALFDSQLESRFMRNNESWVSAQLNELVEIKHGFAFDGAHFSNQGEYVLLTPGNFHERGGYRDRGDKQKFFLGDIPTSFILHEGDLLVAMTEQAFGLLGSPIVLPGSAQFLHNQRLGLVVPNPGRALSRSFLYHLFNTSHVRKAIQSSASGVKVRHTSPGKIGAINVRFPESVSEQEDVAAALTALDHELLRLCALYERRLLAYELLTKAMLDEAFTDTGQAAA
jgi:type I restriction enzyme S subunit